MFTASKLQSSNYTDVITHFMKNLKRFVGFRYAQFCSRKTNWHELVITEKLLRQEMQSNITVDKQRSKSWYSLSI